MDNELKKKYGLPTAIALVIGIVIGSGVFFKAEKILTATGGNLPLGILAWAIGGLIMIICAYMFSILATRYAHVNGLVDYAEALMGKRYAYYMGWFTTFIYFPAMTSVLAWVSARYLGVLCGFDITGGPVMVLACLFLVGSYAVNALSPILAGKFQVATTVIKLIPLLLMGIVGTIVGFANGTTIENFTTVVTTVEGGNGHALFTAVAATAFAYEGWIIATSINAELKDARRNLPIALVVGTLIVALTYILYYIGLSGSVSNAEIMAGGEAGAKLAFREDLRPGRRRGSVRAGRRVVPRHAQRAHARRDAQPLLCRCTRQRPEAGGVPRHRPIHEHAGKLRHRGRAHVRRLADVFLWCQPHRGLVRPVLLRLVRAADHHALRALYSDVPQRHAPGKGAERFSPLRHAGAVDRVLHLLLRRGRSCRTARPCSTI